MSELQELYAVSSEGAHKFFFSSLLQVLRDKNRRFKEDELFYISNILANYSIKPVNEFSSNPVLKNGLVDVLDLFVLKEDNLDDPQILEWGGSQVILFAGFFRDQMAKRHNLSFYDKVGQSLYSRVGINSSNYGRRKFFDEFSGTVPMWTRTCCDLSRHCRRQRYLLRID